MLLRLLLHQITQPHPAFMQQRTEVYLHVAEQGVGPDIVQLTVEHSVPHHPGEGLGGRAQLGRVEGDLAVAHVDRELLEAGQEVLVLREDGAEALLLRALGHLAHKLEEALAGGGDDEVLVLQAPLHLQAADRRRPAVLLQGMDLHRGLS